MSRAQALGKRLDPVLRVVPIGRACGAGGGTVWP